MNSISDIEFNSTSSSSISSTSSFGRISFEHDKSNNVPISPKPHRSSDAASAAILAATLRRQTSLTFRDFRLVRRIGAGDVGKVYLCHLEEDEQEKSKSKSKSKSNCVYAMKVVEKEVLEMKKKAHRAEMEKRILKMLDHPFLPNVYAQFEDSRFSCIVMEFCSGGDLHSLRHKMPLHRFSFNSARFYAAEVLVALEYLHMLGIIYRDLKPENVLVRSDGHIMLSDFDLSLCSDSIAAVESPYSSPDPSSSPSSSSPTTVVSYRQPGPFSCFPDGIFRSKKVETLDRLFVAEPVTARSCSFVGTHEYVAPEVASGRSHGNAVDWWAFGIFIYEMIYGRTPFSGATNEATLRNIVKKPLTFPTDAPISSSELHARGLICGLLVKDPSSRLGSKRGAAEVKTHPFFKSLNFALIRTITPPGLKGKKMSIKGGSTAFDCF